MAQNSAISASAPTLWSGALKKCKNTLVLSLPKWDREAKKNIAHVDLHEWQKILEI